MPSSFPSMTIIVPSSTPRSRQPGAVQNDFPEIAIISSVTSSTETVTSLRSTTGGPFGESIALTDLGSANRAVLTIHADCPSQLRSDSLTDTIVAGLWLGR